MNIHKISEELNTFFYPRGIAVIGASSNPEKVGYGVVKGLKEGGMYSRPGLKGFSGNIYPVNPSHPQILGLKCYPSVKDIPGIVDLAVICVPAKVVPVVMKECVEKGVKSVIIISAGFSEAGEEGKRLQEEFLKIAREGGIRIIGPNCLGILYPPNNLNASFGLTLPYSGKVAFISQSGALVDSVIDWALKEKYGFSAVISYGNKADLDVPHFLAWACEDEYTHAICIYIEGVNDGRLLLEISKQVTPKKPVIALKAGKSSAGSRAVSSHTGSLSGSYNVYLGAFRQSGIIPANSLTHMFNLAKALSSLPILKGNRIAIVTNGGGCGVLCTDALEELGMEVPAPQEEMIKRLDATGLMHPAWSRNNPFDIVGDATPERYRVALEEVMKSPLFDGVIVIQTLQTMTDTVKDAEIVVEMFKKYKKPVVTSFMGGELTQEGVKILEENGIPNFNDVYDAATVMHALYVYGKWREKENEGKS